MSCLRSNLVFLLALPQSSLSAPVAGTAKTFGIAVPSAIVTPTFAEVLTCSALVTPTARPAARRPLGPFHSCSAKFFQPLLYRDTIIYMYFLVQV